MSAQQNASSLAKKLRNKKKRDKRKIRKLNSSLSKLPPRARTQNLRVLKPTMQQARSKSFRSGGSSNMPSLPSYQGDLKLMMSTSKDPYCMSLVYPKGFMTRVPDSYPRCTALVRSIQVFDLSVDFYNSTDTGRFAAAFQPIVGDLSMLNHGQNIIVDGIGAGWPGDVPNFILNAVGNANPLIDQFFDLLTQGELGSFSLGQSAAPDNTLFGPLPSVFGAPGTGIDYVYSELNPTTSSFTGLEPGVYVIAVSLVYNPAIAPGQITTYTITPPVAANLIDYYDKTTPAAAPVAQASFLVWNVMATTDSFNIINNSLQLGNVDNGIVIARTYSGAVDATLDAGLVDMIRPVAMSVLATSLMTEITAGGSIATVLMPGDCIDKNFLINSASGSQQAFTNWEALAKAPQSYNGKFADGTYCWWSPSSDGDKQFYSVKDMNDRDYPTIFVAGQVNYPQATIGTPLVAIRLEVVRVFEIQTTSLFLESECQYSSQAVFDYENGCLKDVPHCSANSDHLGWIRRLRDKIMSAAGTVSNFYSKNKAIIDPLASFAGSALLAL
jgi:hypothetical protein